MVPRGKTQISEVMHLNLKAPNPGASLTLNCATLLNNELPQVVG